MQRHGCATFWHGPAVLLVLVLISTTALFSCALASGGELPIWSEIQSENVIEVGSKEPIRNVSEIITAVYSFELADRRLACGASTPGMLLRNCDTDVFKGIIGSGGEF